MLEASPPQTKFAVFYTNTDIYFKDFTIILHLSILSLRQTKLFHAIPSYFSKLFFYLRFINDFSSPYYTALNDGEIFG